ncbi:MAG TPA: non-homologous end-joining DNA ligase [Pyrinomonadaceae bacterium]|nr:non-homologous end-joining DNA ligase [Pyrinomonadaceae bacterium]
MKKSSAIDSAQLKNLAGARKATLPDFVPLQLATLTAEAPAGDNWLHELKFDGYRMLCHLDRGKIRFWSRNQKDWSEKFPNLTAPLKALPAVTALLDGEVVVLDKSGHSSFQRLQQSMKGGAASFVFQVFDVIYLNGYDLRRTPLIERKALLEQLLALAKPDGPLRYSDHVVGSGPEFLKQACKLGLEGIVSKLADSVYESTRSRNWLKVKCHLRQEFVIAGYTDSKNDFPGFGSLILGVYDKKNLVYAGRVGTGFSIKQRVALQQQLERISQPASSFLVIPKVPELRRAHWVKPQLVGEVEFTEWTDEGYIRHPSFQGLREDKKAKDVVRERPQ